MAQINTSYNYPIPPENVYGQSIAGPSVENVRQSEQYYNHQTQTTETSKSASKEETKGRYVDTYA